MSTLPGSTADDFTPTLGHFWKVVISISFNCLSWDEKVTEIDYYGTFRTTVEDEKHKIADFTIYNNVITAFDTIGNFNFRMSVLLKTIY